ncbi:hypothetical protein GBBBJNDB_00161 [Pseudomonas phage Callisto]|uniref:Uncharacterized protein n=1 Tax=Pseudomonas phage vB_PaeM_PA5oct TaxID=2163605 RepID=A0A4Y1LUY9_9CAUD|nr:hypothetical protein PQE65_gp165 [Pseudomonas phage vB_PaeM_PA5oct]WMI31864.1 hypothetical protein GBBBJNDB_00161 [Pseudomonas phage Callisto]WPK39315.1 hypothetical protein Deiofobo_0118 [Pseudomonas phage Deifobo]WPK39827.1 hypothetical protein ETTORE_0118 [Pseudomonas phage Ettore]BDR25727.1 hypothetical protein RVBP16_1670 [Pseudomonas phage sp. 30-2]QCG76200.1 hypothetical protein EST35_0319 [Pseudomonas phage vB_PaeM_PA5oct]
MYNKQLSGIYTTTTINSMPASYSGLTDLGMYDTELSVLRKKIEQIEKMLCMLEVDKLLSEKYPALKSAYDEYEVILSIINGTEKKE